MIDGRFHQHGKESAASFATGRCGRQENANLHRWERVFLFEPSCTTEMLSGRPCCLYCQAARCRRSPVYCCIQQHPVRRSSSIPTNLCIPYRNSSESLRVSEWHPRLLSSPETCIYKRQIKKFTVNTILIFRIKYITSIQIYQLLP